MKLYIDLETYSPVPIDHGVYKYAEQAEILICAWAFNGSPPQIWEAYYNSAPPLALIEALRDCDEIIAHNAAFDRVVLEHALPKLCPPRIRWRCTMVRALSHSLPASLEGLCRVFKLPEDTAKLASGKKLIKLFCQPRPKGCKSSRATPEMHPEEWASFVGYAGRDIIALKAIDKKIPRTNDRIDTPLWHLDQTINERGVCIDTQLAESAIAAVTTEQERLSDEMWSQTLGGVSSATQRDTLLAYLRDELGIPIADLKKATVQDAIDRMDLPEHVVEILRNRLAACSTSTAKYRRILDWTSSDGRLRGSAQFRGASRTGRWAGRGPQFQNLPRSSLPPAGIEALKAGCADITHPHVMELSSAAVRGVIVPQPGYRLLVSDLSMIEGRVLAWVAGEEWKLKAFRDYDAGTGPDLYIAAYARTFGVDPGKVTKAQRQIGKVLELSMGYQGAVGAFVSFAEIYGIDLEALASDAASRLPKETLITSARMREWCAARGMPDYGLSDRAWTVCDAIKSMWRQAHPEITALWGRLQLSAAKTLYDKIPRPQTVGHLTLSRDKAWLKILLPSGRTLCYPNARLTDDDRVQYDGMNLGKWGRQTTYGGKLAENITQAIACDVLAHGLRQAEDKHYRPVLHIHDEIIAEVPDDGVKTAAGLSALMATPPEWALDLPLAAAGFETHRYRKD